VTLEETAAMTASDGLAPARCRGLLVSLSTSRLAALGAGPAHTAAATRRSFVAAGEALRVKGDARRGQGRACGGRHVRATESCGNNQGAAPMARNSGGAAAGWGAARRRPRSTWRHPRLIACGRGELEGVCLAASTALNRGRAAEVRMVERARDYSLVYDVVALAPSFGRTRGMLRGAAGYRLEWPASRTRASLADARVAEAEARRAWRASELSLELLRVDCERLRRFVNDVEELRVFLSIARTSVKDECERARAEQIVAKVIEILSGLHTQARERLSHFYWGVWGSARRVKASARELDVLEAAVREAEYGDWEQSLPGGSMWLAAAAAVGDDSGQLGGSSGTSNCHASSDVAMQVRRPDSDSDDDSGGHEVDAEVDGRRATGGGHADMGWCGGDGGGTWVLRHTHEACGRPDEVRRKVVEQTMMSRFGELLGEGDEEEPVVRVCWPDRKRLWWAWTYRRRRRLRNWGRRRAVGVGARTVGAGAGGSGGAVVLRLRSFVDKIAIL
jgi:hypothetical protein